MLKEIKKLSEQFENVEDVKKELKRIQSIKCRLKKQKTRDDYEDKMSEIVKKEQALKEVRQFLVPEKLTVTRMSEEDISILNFDETQKAIKSIQSKKCNVQYNSENLEDNVEYQEAVRIERLLKEHRKLVKPIEDTVIKKSDINELLNNLEDADEMEKDEIVERLRKLL